jgi:hypothetical protein
VTVMAFESAYMMGGRPALLLFFGLVRVSRVNEPASFPKRSC